MTDATQTGVEVRRDVVVVLDADPDLGAVIPEDEFDLARRTLIARPTEVAPGPWDPDADGEIDVVGLLVLEGLLTREVDIGGAKSLELLGAGDVIRPWDDESELSPISSEAALTALEPARLAYLDRRFMAALGRWPTLGGEIIHRVLRRSRWLAVRMAIGSLQGVADRVQLLFWHMASNWGKVTPEGTLVPFSLTHELIAELIGARRPSVTTAIGELRSAGALERALDGWLLKGPPPRAR
ncbi:MAG: Crp/Fnr family transcriptional regulator [Solirubrobacterales bacterium]